MKQPKSFARIIAKNHAAATVLADFPAAGRSDEQVSKEPRVNGVGPAIFDNSACLPPHADPATVGRAIPAVAQSIVKVCSCCGAQYTHTQWLSLRLRGIQKSPGGPDLELRDCTHCVGTMAVEVFT